MRDYKKHKLRFSPYLEKLYQSDKPMIIYKFGNKYKIFTDFSKKIILNKTNGKNISLLTHIDSSLLGGLIVKYGSKMIDTSIRTKLNNLELAMKGAN